MSKLRGWHAETEYHLEEDVVFVSMKGPPLDPDNVRARTLKPVVEEVGAPWAGFHTLRHTYASLMLARGANLLQLSRSLGHHSAAFTLATYAHLLDGEHAPPLDLAAEVGLDSRDHEEQAATSRPVDVPTP